MNLNEFILSISENDEKWLDIPDYQDLYMISSYGRVIAKEKVVNNRYRDVLKPCRLLKTSTSGNRLTVTLSRNGTDKKLGIAILVAKLFLPEPKSNEILKFKDKNSLNCNVNNLIWCPKIDKHVKYVIQDLEGEIWKDVKDFEGYYAISNKGRLKSLSRDIVASNRIIHTQDRIMEITPNISGYLYVTLSKNGVYKKRFVHKLVAEAFIPNPNNYPHIDHIDTNKLNNCVDNLRWVTPVMNMNNELTKKHVSEGLKGKTNESWNCTPIVQLQGGLLVKQYPSIAEAKRAGFGYSGIQRCLARKQYTHKGYTWMYLVDYLKLAPQTAS